MHARITPLPYQSDSSVYFLQIKHLPWAVWLDSGAPSSQQGRYDILTAAPHCRITTQGAMTTLSTDADVRHSEDCPFTLLKKELKKYPSISTDLPFTGGALGYFAYDLGQRLEVLPNSVRKQISLPEMAVGIYTWAIVTDHQQQQSYLILPEKNLAPQHWPQIKQAIQYLTHTARPDDFHVTGPCQSNLSKDDYAQRFGQIMQHIQQGDTYQINFAQRWQVATQGDPWFFYQQLRQSNPAPFAAYMQLPKGAILSASPERFLTVHQQRVLTMPIKGTAARHPDPQRDRFAAQQLLSSTKDRAENTMIVDLMRNDLGKTARLGSIKVNALCALQSFANVHHLVSTVEGELQDAHSLDCLRACFPGGSITGAPKIRAMELIDQYEIDQRHVYCGAIGYIDFNGDMDMNIAIRTAVAEANQLYFWAGGGIVADSVCEQEYQETLDKIKPFLACCARASQAGVAPSDNSWYDAAN